jgi:hypothetical protein
MKEAEQIKRRKQGVLIKFDWKSMNGIELFTKEWFVVIFCISFIFALVCGLIYDGII